MNSRRLAGCRHRSICPPIGCKHIPCLQIQHYMCDYMIELQGGEQPRVAAANGRQKGAVIPTTEHRPLQQEMVCTIQLCLVGSSCTANQYKWESLKLLHGLPPGGGVQHGASEGRRLQTSASPRCLCSISALSRNTALIVGRVVYLMMLCCDLWHLMMRRPCGSWRKGRWCLRRSCFALSAEKLCSTQ